MKTNVLFTIFTIGLIAGLYAQKPTLTLTFTAENMGQNVPLNSILIENLTQGGDTTLNYPDTVLMLNYYTGIGNDETVRDVFSVSQNYPNPMEGKTKVNLFLPEREEILITISDIIGRDLINKEYQLERGSHSFSFNPGKENIYFFTARFKHQYQTIKMFNSPSYADYSGIYKLEYDGKQADLHEYKAGENLNNFGFDLGDQLNYTASTALGDMTIIDTPSENQTYTFEYNSGGTPCPDMPTITDIDGNEYNTILIGEQCWMRENLKTTTYQNGTSIPYVTDDWTWMELTTGAYVWYDKDINWKDPYGALYNWFATVDPNGLCPSGWHVPTNDEWTTLTDFIGGIGIPYGDELKSCRQENSPLGGECNTTEHPRWSEHYKYYGTDNYNFSCLPGGYRHSSGEGFHDIGLLGFWWTSTEESSYTAWYRGLNAYTGYVEVNNLLNKGHGFSIRCLRD